MTSGLVHAFDDICDALEPLSIGTENEFLRFLTDQSILSLMSESKDKEISKLKKALDQEQTKSEKLEITLKHVRARLDDQFWMREQAELKMRQMQEEVQRFYRMRDLLCSDVKYSGLLMRDRRFDPILNYKSGNEFLSSTEDSTSGTESLSLSVSLTDGSLEVADADADMTVLRSKMRYRKPSHRSSLSAKRLSDNIHRSVSKRTKSEDPLAEILAHNNIRKASPLPPLSHPIKKLAEFSRPPAMKGRRKPSVQHLKSRFQAGNFLEQFYLSSGTESSSETNTGTSSCTSSDEHPIFNANPKLFPFPAKTPRTPKKMSPKRAHTWFNKTVIKVERCDGCQKKIGFSNKALKCRDCGMLSHKECQGKVSAPCKGFAVKSPGGTTVGDNFLESHCQRGKVKIPPIIMACVEQVEKNGLDKGGIYRVNGSSREVKELVEQFRLGEFPNLDRIEDINVICSSLKTFLLNLDEPIVTHDLQPSFVKVAEMSEDQAQEALRDLFTRLPRANQMTLSYIITHLQHVSQNSERNHMSDLSLGRVFGPTLIGNSTPNPDNKDIWDDVQKRPIVVSRMLQMDGLEEYFARAMRAINIPRGMVSPPITPGGLSAPSSNYLGSVSPERRRAKLNKEHSFFPPT